MNIIDTLKDRLRAAMADRALRPAPLSRAAGLNESAVRDILRGRSCNPGVVTLSRLAGVLKIRSAALIESPSIWPTLGAVDDHGAVTPLGEDDPDFDGMENPFIGVVDADLAVLVNRGQALRPFSTAGDYLVVRPHDAAGEQSHLGAPCLCRLTDGRMVIRTPRLGDEPGRFHLSPLNPFAAPELNMRLVSASRLLLALPPAFAQSAIPRAA